MPLVDFIREHAREIIDQFEAFARTVAPTSMLMTAAELRDHAQELLTAIVDDPGELPEPKSMSEGTKRAMTAVEAAHLHADARIAQGFGATAVLAEFRALRANVLRLYAHHGGVGDLQGIQRFNEAVDETLTASLERFSERVDTSKNQFIGMLGHDLRTPLGAIMAGATLLTQCEDVEHQRVWVASRILRSAERMARMITDLLDLTRTRLGAGIPIARRPTDLQQICQDVVLEIQTFHPDATLQYVAEGDLHCEWDPDRLTQVASNLIANALQHGDGTPVRVVARGAPDDVLLTVHNEGRSIPQDAQALIFEPLARYAPTATEEGNTTSIGLGLFIARAIVVAHGGTITVSSTNDRGTTFEVRLPRRHPSDRAA
jgi:signal transduction histidine kinase